MATQAFDDDLLLDNFASGRAARTGTRTESP